jgi:hypothetical protein
LLELLTEIRGKEEHSGKPQRNGLPGDQILLYTTYARFSDAAKPSVQEVRELLGFEEVRLHELFLPENCLTQCE